MSKQKSKLDIAQTVTDAVIAGLERIGNDPFKMPFIKGGGNYNVIRGPNKPYQGVNVLLTSFTKYDSPVWGTYGQWFTKGGGVKSDYIKGQKQTVITPSKMHVRKGETATLIIFYKIIEVEDRDAADPKTAPKKRIPLLKYSKVFNAEQVEGADQFLNIGTDKTDSTKKLDGCDAFFDNLGILTKTASGRAFYSPAHDFVSVPPRQDFLDTGTSNATENYYSTLAHEYGHATGHKSRLDREFSGGFGSAKYAAEELVAELTAAMFMASQGVTMTVREDHIKYIKSWLRALKDDKNFIIPASSKAQTALNWMNDQQPQTDEMAEAA